MPAPTIVRALDLAAQRGDMAPTLAGPIYFVALGLRRAWPELAAPDGWMDPREVPAARWGPGENIWVIGTYLKLRRFGLDVRIVDRVVPDAVNVCYLDAALAAPESHRAFIVVAQGDRCYLEWGEYTIAQSPAIAARPRTCLIDMWPQPGLIPRDAARGTVIRNVGYSGHPGNLAPEFRSDRFRADLAALGVELLLRSEPEQWHDFHDLDLHFAVRDPAEAWWTRTKPSTKLIHSWLAGVPALLGPEPSYRYWGEDGSDYAEVTSPADVVAWVRRLQSEPALYRTMQERGRLKAVGHDEHGVCRQWAAVLAGPVAERFGMWRDAGAGADVRRRVLRAWRLAAVPASRVWFFARARGWRGNVERFWPRSAAK